MRKHLLNTSMINSLRGGKVVDMVGVRPLVTTGVLRFERENPARIDELVGTVDATDPAGVHAAVARARSAQRAWAAMDLGARCAAVRAGADLIAAEIDDLAVLMARETGKVLPDCRGELGFSVTVLRWSADRAEELLVDEVVDDEAGRLLIRRRPYGVVAAVTPWNAPVILAALKLGPALVSGNAVVVKPSPLAPFAIARVIELLGAALARTERPRASSRPCRATPRRRPRWSATPVSTGWRSPVASAPAARSPRSPGRASPRP